MANQNSLKLLILTFSNFSTSRISERGYGAARLSWREVLCILRWRKDINQSMDEQTKSTKKPFYKRWWVWVLGVIILFIIIGASGGKGQPKESIPANDKPATQTLLNLSASGTKTTQKFTAASDWDLDWSYNCSNFGPQGNFQVMIYNGDGSLSLKNALINQLGKSDSGVEYYHNSGTYYLVVNSECSWEIQVKS